MADTTRRPFRGTFSSADARAVTLSESQARFSLYDATTLAAITLASTDTCIIESVEVATLVYVTIKIYSGANDTIDAGEMLCLNRSTPDTNSPPLRLVPGRACVTGSYPKVEASLDGQIDVLIHGYVSSP